MKQSHCAPLGFNGITYFHTPSYAVSIIALPASNSVTPRSERVAKSSENKQQGKENKGKYGDFPGSLDDTAMADEIKATFG